MTHRPRSPGQDPDEAREEEPSLPLEPPPEPGKESDGVEIPEELVRGNPPPHEDTEKVPDDEAPEVRP